MEKENKGQTTQLNKNKNEELSENQNGEQPQHGFFRKYFWFILFFIAFQIGLKFFNSMKDTCCCI